MYKRQECGFHSPDYDYAGGDVDTRNMTMEVRDRKGSGSYNLLSDSVFNIYNMVAAIALFRELGMSHDEISRYMNQIKIVESRYNEVTVEDVTLVMQMAKDKNALEMCIRDRGLSAPRGPPCCRKWRYKSTQSSWFWKLGRYRLP